MSNLLTITKSWLADNAMVLAAQKRLSTGSTAYAELEPRMTRAPTDVLVAYEQASYFLALGARRAQREGETTAQTALLNELTLLLADAADLKERVSAICLYTGTFCPSKGSAQVLSDAADAIEASGLNVDDAARITAILRGNARSVQLKKLLPVIGLIGIAAIAGSFWYRKHKRL